MLGRVLKNRYKLIDERGSGSMATVYIGRDLETNRLYAVKVLSRQAAAESELVERFQREFELLTRLSGPHVVSPVDFGEDRGSLFIVMDYIDGHNLKHAVLTHGPFPLSRAVDCVEQAAAGVAAAADQSIVHRDIKPQNLLLSAANVVKLTDFGLARSHESRDITVTGFFVGTPFYVAPEQVENSRRADVRADLYSLACVFFELLTARVPYDGEHAWDVVLQHLNGQPGDRYQTPRAFVEAIEALPTSEPGTGGTPAASEQSGMLITPSGAQLPLTAPDMVIGRSDPQRGVRPDLDLLAFDPAQTVSRRHARLTRSAGHFYIEDLNAFNRTRVNGTPLVPHQEAELHTGDALRLGNVELRFEIRSR